MRPLQAPPLKGRTWKWRMRVGEEGFTSCMVQEEARAHGLGLWGASLVLE